MQIAKSQGNIVEKVIRNKDGKLIRARFFVYENAGRIKARLLDFTYIEELAQSVILAISGIVKTIIVWSRKIESKAIAPFLNSETIYLSGSKPRAPTI